MRKKTRFYHSHLFWSGSALLFNPREKIRRMMLKIGGGLRSREIGFESKDWIHYVSVLLGALCGFEENKEES
jgi:hypothetical protein